VFGEGQNTSDTHQLRLGTGLFLTFQDVMNLVDHGPGIRDVPVNVGSGSMRVFQWRRRRFSGCTKSKHHTVYLIVVEIADLA